jgi:hypothetical protein
VSCCALSIRKAVFSATEYSPPLGITCEDARKKAAVEALK